ncbi:MAG: hypothetical protein WA949_19190 [Phormidesmis sp.]
MPITEQSLPTIEHLFPTAEHLLPTTKYPFPTTEQLFPTAEQSFPTVETDGSLQIQLPEHHNEEVELLIVYQPTRPMAKRQRSQQFLDFFGAWEGEPLERAPQEVQPERSTLL